MIVLDTNVVSALRRPDRHPGVTIWLHDQRADDLYLSAITLGELERGLELRRRRKPGSSAALALWIEETNDLFRDRILPFDGAAARLWGRLSATLGHDGSDLQIAATALIHGATIATRNLADFRPAGVPTVNPFAVDEG